VTAVYTIVKLPSHSKARLGSRPYLWTHSRGRRTRHWRILAPPPPPPHAQAVTELNAVADTESEKCFFFVIEFLFYSFKNVFGGLCWPVLCLCRPFCISERCLDSNPAESCRSKHVRYQLSHPSSLLNCLVYFQKIKFSFRNNCNVTPP
jgi:hypothetical protein